MSKKCLFWNDHSAQLKQMPQKGHGGELNKLVNSAQSGEIINDNKNAIFFEFHLLFTRKKPENHKKKV